MVPGANHVPDFLDFGKKTGVAFAKYDGWVGHYDAILEPTVPATFNTILRETKFGYLPVGCAAVGIDRSGS